MHVLMLCALEVWALPKEGGAPTLHRTLRAYSERGHRVTFVTATVGANAYLPEGDLGHAPNAPDLEIPGLIISRLHVPSLQEMRVPLPAFVKKVDQKLRFAFLFPRLAAKRAEDAILRDPPDLIYGYEVHGVLSAMRLGRKLPAVSRFQGTILFPHMTSLLGRLRRYEEVQALRAPADLYVMTDDGTRGDEVLARLNPQAASRLRFWRNGLDLDRLIPVDAGRKAELRRELDIPRDGFVLLTASRLAAWKRIDRAVAALPQVLAVEPKTILIVVGDGEERGNLQRQAERLGVDAHVRFEGPVEQERVSNYMQASDVLLALAGLSNVGNPLLEAMSCGMAVVAVDAGDTRELIRDRETGLLLPSGNASIVARAVGELARSGDIRQRLTHGARQYAIEHFWTWDDRLRAEIDEVEQIVATMADKQTIDV